MDIRIMLADDQAMMRTAMRNLLMTQTDVVSVALANDGAQAVAVSCQGGVDVAVLDISMPGVNGITALVTLQRELPRLPVVMLSTTTDAQVVRRCLKLGALGYVAKQSACDELIKAVRAVLAGETYLCRIVRESLAAYR